MSHKRTPIRQACMDTLRDTTSANDRVFSNRALPLFGMPLPAINVFATEESNRSKDVASHYGMRKLEVVVDVYAQATESLDDDLDVLANEVEARLSEEGAWGEDVIDAVLTGTQIDITEVGEVPAGVVRLAYQVTYLA